MRHRIAFLLFTGLLATCLVLLSRTGGPAFMANMAASGAPGDVNCYACHYGGTQDGFILIEPMNMPSGGFEQGQTYRFRAVVADSDAYIAGFQALALDSRDSTIGEFLSSANTQTVWLGMPAVGMRQYIEHAYPRLVLPTGNSLRTAEWTFDWTAPGQYSGPVTFYIAGLGSNWNGQPSDDAMYTASFSVSALSVEWSDVAAALTPEGKVRLDWGTLREENSLYFEVERSADGQFFQPVGQVQAAGNTTSARNYHFEDAVPHNTARWYYRIRESDANGGVQHSDVVSVAIPPLSTHRLLSVGPTPAIMGQPLGVELLMAAPTALSLRLLDMHGRLHFEAQAQLEAGFQRIELPTAQLPRGYYTLVLQSGDFLRGRKVCIVN